MHHLKPAKMGLLGIGAAQFLYLFAISKINGGGAILFHGGVVMDLIYCHLRHDFTVRAVF